MYTEPVSCTGSCWDNRASPAAGKQVMGMAWEPKEESAFPGQFFHS